MTRTNNRNGITLWVSMRIMPPIIPVRRPKNLTGLTGRLIDHTTCLDRGKGKISRKLARFGFSRPRGAHGNGVKVHYEVSLAYSAKYAKFAKFFQFK